MIEKVCLKVSIYPPSFFVRVGGKNPVVATKSIERELTPLFLQTLFRGPINIPFAAKLRIYGSVNKEAVEEISFTPPIFQVICRMTAGTLGYIQDLRAEGWIIDQEAVAYYGFQ